MSESFSPTIRVEHDLMLTPPAPAATPAGEGMLPSPILGEYYLVREIARGGMGVVFEACHVRLARLVALKIVHHTRFAKFEDFGRFRAETEAAARLDHPNIVPIYEVGEADGLPFFTMKLIKGDSLSRRLREGRMEPKAAARLVAKVARAVQHAHERGVLHRDLKPGNILVDENGEPWLTDFGLAKCTHLEKELTMTGDLLGTPEYMSPEHTHCEPALLTTACDVWALGVLLYQLVSGNLPFRGESMLTTMQAIVGKSPAPLDTPPDLATIIQRCLEKNPNHRLISAGFLADELDRWLAGKPIQSRRVSTAERAWKWMRRHPWPVAALLALTFSIVAGSITSLVLWQRATGANESLTKTNEQLARSLNHANAVRLSTESRTQVRDDVPLGLLLAAEAAETTTTTGEPILPEAFSALVQGLQENGGVNSTASRGLSAPNVAALLITSQRSLLPSPDGRWFLTYNTSKNGVVFALYDAAPPFSETPRRQWYAQRADGRKADVRMVCWTPDSRKIVVADDDRGDLREFDILAGLDKTRHLLSGPPPFRTLGGTITAPNTFRDPACIVRDAAGNPTGFVHVELVNPDGPQTHPLFWHSFNLAAEKPLGEPIDLSLDGARDARRGFEPSPDGQWVLNFEPWGPDTPLLLHVLPGGAAPETILLDPIPATIMESKFSPDGRWLVLSCQDGTVRLHDLAPGHGAAAIRAGIPFVRTGKQCRGIAFSPNGQWLALAGLQSQVTVLPVAALPHAEGAMNFNLSAGSATGLAFSQDSHWLAACADDQSVNVWAVDPNAQGARPVEFRGLATAPYQVCFSPDGQVLAAIARGGECRRWEFNPNGAGVLPIATNTPNEEFSVKSTAVSPDGRWVATATAPRAADLPAPPVLPIHLYDSRAPQRDRVLPGHAGPSGVAFSSDSEWFASVGRDATINLWHWPELLRALVTDRALPEPIHLVGEHTRLNYPRHLAFHPSGRLFCTSGDGVLFQWDLRTPDIAASVHVDIVHSIRYLLTDVAVSPDGHWLAVGRHGNDTEPRKGSTQFGNLVLVFDATDPGHLQPRYELRAPFRDGPGLTFSADSRWLAAGAQDAPPAVWDLTAADVPGSLRSAPVTSACIPGVAFLPPRGQDGPWLALAGLDGRLHLWDWQHYPGTLRRIETTMPIRSLATLPDGRPVTGSEDGRLRIWETDPARLIDLARQTAGRDLTKTERTRFQLPP